MPALLWLLLVLAAGSLAAQTGEPEAAEGATEGQAAALASADGASQPEEATWAYAERSADGAPEVSLAGLLLKVGLGLSFVVGLAWGCVFLLKKSSLGQQFAPATAAVRVLERSFLAPKKAIYLVEIGDRTLALGVTEQSINVLSRWPAGQLQLPDRGLPTSGFAAQFRSLLNRRKGAGPSQEVAHREMAHAEVRA